MATSRPLTKSAHEQKPTMITTDKSFAERGDVFPNAACEVALLVHYAEIIGIKGQSYHNKEAQKHARACAAKRKPSKESI